MKAKLIDYLQNGIKQLLIKAVCAKSDSIIGITLSTDNARTAKQVSDAEKNYRYIKL
ncbi:MAG TPA: hypothetical protein ACHBY4_01120 [Arsenophonus apicola]|uniref:hypothetical protein n=1 Tax=Arsenophonus apicola TaxID=2879119 RepID=UPI0038798BED